MKQPQININICWNANTDWQNLLVFSLEQVILPNRGVKTKNTLLHLYVGHTAVLCVGEDDSSD